MRATRWPSPSRPSPRSEAATAPLLLILLAAALLLGLVNAVVRPLVVILTLPITVVTLGIFLLVINGLMVMLVGALLPGLEIAGFGSALLASIVVSLTSWVASWYVGPRGNAEVIVVERH